MVWIDVGCWIDGFDDMSCQSSSALCIPLPGQLPLALLALSKDNLNLAFFDLLIKLDALSTPPHYVHTASVRQ